MLFRFRSFKFWDVMILHKLFNFEMIDANMNISSFDVGL